MLLQNLPLNVSEQLLRNVNWNSWLRWEIWEKDSLPDGNSAHLLFMEIHSNDDKIEAQLILFMIISHFPESYFVNTS